jgi:hypothetical protein
MCGNDFASNNRVYYCPSCEKEYKTKYREKNKKRIAKYNNERFVAIETPEKKRCSCCAKEKPEKSFYKDLQKKTGLSSKCKACTKKKQKL